MTIFQVVMTGVLFGIAYFLLVTFADFGSQYTTVHFVGLAVLLGAVVVTVRKMFPGQT